MNGSKGGVGHTQVSNGGFGGGGAATTYPGGGGDSPVGEQGVSVELVQKIMKE